MTKWILSSVAALLLVGAALGMAKPAHAADQDFVLRLGETLSPGQELISDWCNYILRMQGDGNLVELDPMHGWRVVWASGTWGHPGTIFVNQLDGNMVLIAPGNNAIWSTGTSGHPGTVLTLQNDANIVAYAPGSHAIWASRSGNGQGGTGLQKVVTIAQAIENGQAEPGWSGGAVPYVWGGGHGNNPGPSTGTCDRYTGSIQPCPATHTVGTDCSGFVRWVYSIAYGRDVLPGGTNQQITETHPVSASAAQPGDLLFYGPSTSNSKHVGIYIGNGKIINNLYTGGYVETDSVNVETNFLGYYHYAG